MPPGRGGLYPDKPPVCQQREFTFDGILNDATQEEVFEVCAGEVVEGALAGLNTAILAFGQTGSGKTYTMAGVRRSYEQRGIIPRMLSTLWAQLPSSPSVAAWKLAVSYVEVYNETLFDLLDLTTAPHELVVFEDAEGRPQVAGLRAVDVTSEAQALKLFFEGEANRAIGEHRLNLESSRSHAIFFCHLDIVQNGAARGEHITSKISLVDLAGSERVRKTGSEGTVLREAGHINKSLHMLQQVVLAITDRTRDHVPYRSSRLTHVLKDALGGNSRTVLIANVWGSASHVEESLSTCRFAARMARVKCEVRPNIVQESSARLRQLEREVQELKEELAMVGVWSGVDASVYEPLTEAQRASLEQQVAGWLQRRTHEESTLPVLMTSMRLVRETLMACKMLYHTKDQQQQPQQQAQQSHQPTQQQRQWQQQRPDPWHHGQRHGATHEGGHHAHAVAVSLSPAWPSASAGVVFNGDTTWHGYVPDTAVGDLDGSDESHTVGVAPDDASPATAGPIPPAVGRNACGDASSMQPGSSGDASSTQEDDAVPVSLPGTPPSTTYHHMLAVYHAGPGASMAAQLNQSHAQMRAAKRRAKELALLLNNMKLRIDDVKARCARLQAERRAVDAPDSAQTSATHQDMSNVEFAALSELRQLKNDYREAHGELLAVRSEAEYTAGLVDSSSRELMQAFWEWLRATSGTH